MKLTANPSNSTRPSLLLCLLWSGHQPLTLLHDGWEVEHMWSSLLFLQEILGFCRSLGYFCLSQETFLFHPSLGCRFWAPRKSGTRLSSEVKRATFLRTSLIFTFPRKCHGNRVHHHCTFPQSAVESTCAGVYRDMTEEALVITYYNFRLARIAIMLSAVLPAYLISTLKYPLFFQSWMLLNALCSQVTPLLLLLRGMSLGCGRDCI